MLSRGLLCAVLLALAGSVTAEADTIVDVVVSSSSHTTLAALVTRAGLIDTLKGAGKFTLFAPTDDAFGALGTTSTLVLKITADPISDLWKPLLQDVLKFHVLAGQTSASGLPVTVTQVETLSPGSKLSLKNTAPQVNNATVTEADIMANNGVVHVIDKVLLPTSTSRNVVSIATGITDFSTLVALLTAADLVTTLGTDDVKTAFTVFAPNNAAFAKVDATTVKCLQEAGNKAVLANLLKYHVVNGTVVASALRDKQTITTIATNAANTLTFVADGTKLQTSGTGSSAIKTTDILGTNGVVHIIDTVLIPSDFKCETSVVISAVPKNTTFFVSVTVTLPYTKAEFDQAKQDKYTAAMAATAGTIAANVVIESITEKRRRAGAVDVKTKILASDAAGVDKLLATLGSGDAFKTKLNAELVKGGLKESTGVTAPAKVEAPKPASAGLLSATWALSLTAPVVAYGLLV